MPREILARGKSASYANNQQPTPGSSKTKTSRTKKNKENHHSLASHKDHSQPSHLSILVSDPGQQNSTLIRIISNPDTNVQAEMQHTPKDTNTAGLLSNHTLGVFHHVTSPNHDQTSHPTETRSQHKVKKT